MSAAQPLFDASPLADVIPPKVLTREQRRSRRHREVRGKTISMKRLTKMELEIGRALNPPGEFADVQRPRTRAECARWRVPCHECGGTGDESGQTDQACPNCGGTGLAYLRVVGEGGALENHDSGAAQAWMDARRRGDPACQGNLKPCVWISCRYSLYIDVSLQTGAIKGNFPDLEPSEMTESCALDVADRGGTTLEAVGVYMNVTRERIRQIETRLVKRIPEEQLAVLREFTLDETRDTMKRRLPLVDNALSVADDEADAELDEDVDTEVDAELDEAVDDDVPPSIADDDVLWMLDGAGLP